MPLVPAKCPQCSGNIEVDNTNEAGICKFCGTPFVTEKAINNYNTYVTNNFAGANISVANGNIDNLLKLAESVIEAGNGKEAIEYVSKALEIDPESSRAWFLKMKSIEYIGTVGNPQINEAISYAEKAIKYSNDKECLKEEVYKYYIKRAQDLLTMAALHLSDTIQIKQLASIGISAARGVANGDVVTRNLYLNLAATALILRYNIPEEYINTHEEMQDEIVKLINLLIGVYEADSARLEVYYMRPNSETVQARKDTIESLKKGLNDDKASKIREVNIKASEGGCYIATCVYGSYDCPEVWTLRRYRDYTLAKTLFGRMFIKFYYAISPKLVKYFGNYTWFKMFWKMLLDKKVAYLNGIGVKNTEYNDKR